jgi:hypothetical protein
MPRAVVWLERDEAGGRVIGAYCSRECAPVPAAFPGQIRAARFPAIGDGLVGLALVQLCCQGCGANLSDALGAPPQVPSADAEE